MINKTPLTKPNNIQYNLFDSKTTSFKVSLLPWFLFQTYWKAKLCHIFPRAACTKHHKLKKPLNPFISCTPYFSAVCANHHWVTELLMKARYLMVGILWNLIFLRYFTNFTHSQPICCLGCVLGIRWRYKSWRIMADWPDLLWVQGYLRYFHNLLSLVTNNSSVSRLF